MGKKKRTPRPGVFQVLEISQKPRPGNPSPRKRTNPGNPSPKNKGKPKPGKPSSAKKCPGSPSQQQQQRRRQRQHVYMYVYNCIYPLVI